MPTTVQNGGEMLHLPATNSRLQIGHAVVETDHIMPIAPIWSLTLTAQQPQAISQTLSLDGHHPALTRRNGFVAVEAEAAEMSQTTHRLVLNFCAQCFGGIL